MLPEIPARPGDICLLCSEWWNSEGPPWVLVLKINKVTISVQTTHGWSHQIRESKKNLPISRLRPVPDCLVPPKILEMFNVYRTAFKLQSSSREGMSSIEVLDHVLAYRAGVSLF